MHILNVAVLLLCISCVAFGLICEVWKGHESVFAYVSVRGFQSLFGKAITQITANLVHTLLRKVFRDDSVFGHAVGSMLVVCGQKLKWLKLGFWNHYLASPWCHQMENIFRVAGPLRGESNDHCWILLKGQWRRALMFSLICAWQTVEQAIERLVIWDAIAIIIMSL